MNTKECNMHWVLVIIIWIICPLIIICGCLVECKKYQQYHECCNIENNNLNDRIFEVKSIHVVERSYCNKSPRYYIRRECIVEDIKTKDRKTALYKSQTPPIVGDFYKIRLIEQYSENEEVLYLLSERINRK